MNRSPRSRWNQIPERRKPLETRTLMIFTSSKEHIGRFVVMHILAVDCILDVDWTVTFWEDCWDWSVEDASFANDVRDWGVED